MARVLALLLLVVMIAESAAAGAICAPRALVEAAMREEGKRLVAVAILDPDGAGMIELYADRAGGWALVVTLAERADAACVTQTGAGWQLAPAGDPA